MLTEETTAIMPEYLPSSVCLKQPTPYAMFFKGLKHDADGRYDRDEN